MEEVTAKMDMPDSLKKSVVDYLQRKVDEVKSLRETGFDEEFIAPISRNFYACTDMLEHLFNITVTVSTWKVSVERGDAK